MLDALKRAARGGRQVGTYAETLDAIDDKAAAFCARFGFLGLAGHPNRFYLPVAAIERLGFDDRVR